MAKDSELPKAAVADASAFIQGLPFSGEVKLYTTPLIEQEVEGLKGIELLRASTIEIVTPAEASLRKVQEGAKRTGDDGRLSEADMEVLALALELGLPLITDDYSIQNLARHLGIRYLTIREDGIKEEFHWHYRCVGCRRTFEERTEECPVCGSEVKSSRKGAAKRRSTTERAGRR